MEWFWLGKWESECHPFPLRELRAADKPSWLLFLFRLYFFRYTEYQKLGADVIWFVFLPVPVLSNLVELELTPVPSSPLERVDSIRSLFSRVPEFTVANSGAIKKISLDRTTYKSEFIRFEPDLSSKARCLRGRETKLMLIGGFPLSLSSSSEPTAMYSMLNFFGNNMVTTEDEEWKRHRKVASPSFHQVRRLLLLLDDPLL